VREHQQGIHAQLGISIANTQGPRRYNVPPKASGPLRDNDITLNVFLHSSQRPSGTRDTSGLTSGIKYLQKEKMEEREQEQPKLPPIEISIFKEKVSKSSEGKAVFFGASDPLPPGQQAGGFRCYSSEV